MWKNFIEQNSSNLKITLISNKNGKLNDKSIKILSNDFAYLICSSNNENESLNENINIEYTKKIKSY